MTVRHLFLALLLVLSPLPLQAQEAPPAAAQSEWTKTTLVSRYDAIEPGKPETLNVAVVLEPAPGWHMYWENPGDAGLPVTLTWTLPEGFTAGPIDWPAPEPIMEGQLLTYSYTSTLFLPVALTAPANLKPGDSYPIKVNAEWLICKDICVPDSAELQIVLPVVASGAAPGAHAALFEDHLKIRPQTPPSPGAFSIDGNKLNLSLPLDLKGKTISDARFFIREQNLIHYAAKQEFTADDKGVRLTLERSEDEAPGGSISGILTLTEAGGAQSHYNAVFNNQASAAGAGGANATQNLWFPAVLLLAVLGGLVLNLMPCVLPVLSLKALAIVRKGGGRHEHVVAQGLTYTLGILLSFALIASVLLALRGAGEAIGWGFQMQSPAFVGFLIYLLFIVGLNLSGIFHLPVLLGNIGGDIANENSVRGSFFTGILAAAVATPCTAPFMASAVGAALTMPAWQALLVFEAMGFGLALPFLLISLFPVLRKRLPKPGAWMETFRQLIAFPMYASVIWLLWVLTLQTGAGGMVIALSGLLFIVAVIWMRSLFHEDGHAYGIAALLLYAALLAVSLPMLNRMEGAGMMPVTQEMQTVPYSKEKLESLRASGTPVLVDATAAWCITCQVNAHVAIHTGRTMKAMNDRHVVLMIADWTRRNDDITEFLSSFGYKGVPLVVFYPAKGGAPVVLPQILTEDIVINTINGDH